MRFLSILYYNTTSREKRDLLLTVVLCFVVPALIYLDKFVYLDLEWKGIAVVIFPLTCIMLAIGAFAMFFVIYRTAKRRLISKP